MCERQYLLADNLLYTCVITTNKCANTWLTHINFKAGLLFNKQVCYNIILIHYFYLMSGKTSFKIKYELPTRLSVVYDSLMDFKKFGELHPYMKQVDLVLDKRPEFTEYKIVEEVYFFGFIKNQPEYNARVYELEKNKCIQYTSQVKSFIFLTITFHLSEGKDGAVSIQEEFEIKCNKLIGYIFSDILKKSHARVFENIKKLAQ